MARLLYLGIISLIVSFLMGCPKEVASYRTTSRLEGVWVKENDMPGRQPADTLFFIKKNGRDILAFYSAGSPGPNWPSEAETEYKFENDKFSFKDYSGTTHDFMTVESFQWIKPGNEFSVKLYQILLFMSADYRVTYRKIN